MSKITFRADDDLIAQLEEFDASKSEVMREALREYLGEAESSRSRTSDADDAETLDEMVAERVDEIVAERVDGLVAERLDGAFTPRRPQDINVNVSLDGANADREASTASADASRDVSHASSNDPSHAGEERKTDPEDSENADAEARNTCTQCGETLSPSHVYCPNCGEKASRRVFCECGDELRSDWAFCPSCGRRTPAADVLDQSDRP